MTDAKRPLTEAGRSITQWAEIGDGSITRLVVECERQAVVARLPDYEALREAAERLTHSRGSGEWLRAQGDVEDILARLRDEVPA